MSSALLDDDPDMRDYSTRDDWLDAAVNASWLNRYRDINDQSNLAIDHGDIADEYSRACYLEMMRRTQRVIVNGDAPRWTS